jgi:hypothetical protein
MRHGKRKTTAAALCLILLAGCFLTAMAKSRVLPAKVASLVLQDACSDGCSEEKRASYRRELRLERHDLNRDGVAEFFVYIDDGDWCGAGFNCQYWVFQRRHNEYRLLASEYPVLVPAKTFTNGYRDIESQGYSGGCVLPDNSWGKEIYLTILKYDGTKYVGTEIGTRCRRR